MRRLHKLVLAVAATTGLGACAAPMRSVTHISTWSTDAGDYFYLAYTENNLVSKVKLCRVQKDNGITCTEQPEVDRLLNP